MSRETKPAPIISAGLWGEGGCQSVANGDLQAISEQLLQPLSTVPRILCCIGQCFAIAWSDGDYNIRQERDPELPEYLQMNLEHCSRLGEEALNEGRERMSNVSLAIESITDPFYLVDKILRRLKKKNPSISELSEHFIDLERLANECVQDSKVVVERTKEWQQQVSKVNEAFSTTNGFLSSVSSVGEDNLAISPKGKRSWAKKCNKWIGILRVLELKLKERFLRKKETRAALTTTKSPERAEAKRTEEQQQDNQRRFDETVRKVQDPARKLTAKRKLVSEILQDCQKSMADLDRGTERMHRIFSILYAKSRELIEFAESTASHEGWDQEQIAKLRANIAELYVYYTIAGVTSSTYSEASQRYIVPITSMVSRLGMESTYTQSCDVGELIEEIAHRSREAQVRIHDFAEEVSGPFRNQFMTHKQY